MSSSSVADLQQTRTVHSYTLYTVLGSWFSLILGLVACGVNQLISIKILKARHEHKRSHIPAQPHGQQTPRREASQAWGAKNE